MSEQQEVESSLRALVNRMRLVSWISDLKEPDARTFLQSSALNSYSHKVAR